MKRADKKICDRAVAILRDWAARDVVLLAEDREFAKKRRARKVKRKQTAFEQEPIPVERTLH